MTYVRVRKIRCSLLLVLVCVFFVLFEDLDDEEAVTEGDAGAIVDVMIDTDAPTEDFSLKPESTIKCAPFTVMVVGLPPPPL